MEYTSCFEIYDNISHIPYNIDCGHTFCYYCLKNIIKIKQKCPNCRQVFNNLELTKNLFALELAEIFNQNKNLFDFCEIHNNNFLNFICNDCNSYICSHYLINHSGHIIKKQNYTKDLIKRILVTMKDSIKEVC